MAKAKTVYEALGREPVHPFPARMAPDVALRALSAKKRLRILDPMMGSGTVIAIARKNGHHAIGIDIDPLSFLISKVWTTAIDRPKVLKAAENVLRRAKRQFNETALGEAYPPSADSETRAFIRYWFDPYARRQLAVLSGAIRRVRNDAVRDVLWCAFSRLIIAKQSGASLTLDLAHSRPHRSFEYAPSKPFKKFPSSVQKVVENCISGASSRRGPRPRLYNCDARKAPLKDSSVDLILTSPPYLNAIDYIRCSKFSLVWMGYQIETLRQLRSESVGAEVAAAESSETSEIRQLVRNLRLRPKLDSRNEAILIRYILDMRGAIKEAARIVSRKGRIVYVVGENTIRGTYIPNSSILLALAKDAGLKLRRRSTRALPPNRRYLPPPRTAAGGELNSRMRREVILTFCRNL